MKGAGSVQVRVLLKREPDVQLIKPPQVDQVDQIDHPPSTESQMNDSKLGDVILRRKTVELVEKPVKTRSLPSKVESTIRKLKE